MRNPLTFTLKAKSLVTYCEEQVLRQRQSQKNSWQVWAQVALKNVRPSGKESLFLFHFILTAAKTLE